jgi:hypothetical protein
MYERLIEGWLDTIKRLQTRYCWFGRLIMAGAITYLFLLLAYAGFKLPKISWNSLGKTMLLILGLGFLSLLLQFFVWLRLLSFHHKTGWVDLNIYSRMILLRRIPGFMWQWVGSAVMYSTDTGVPPRIAFFAGIGEWIMLIGIAMNLFLLKITADLGWFQIQTFFLGIIILIRISFFWQPGSRVLIRKIGEGCLWISTYTLAWTLGGLIIFILGKALGGVGLTFFDSLQTWVIAGGIGQLTVITAMGLGIKELTITLLLKPYMPEAAAILVAILVRLALTLADILGGLTGWLISHYFLKIRYCPPGRLDT